jgi:hypothetical protein
LFLQILYQRGARKFLFFGLGPAGCAPVILTDLATQNLPKDDFGCIIAVDSVVQNFNRQLLAQINVFRQLLTGATFSFFSTYDAAIAMRSNATAFGTVLSLTYILPILSLLKKKISI